MSSAREAALLVFPTRVLLVRAGDDPDAMSLFDDVAAKAVELPPTG
jgi:hypothetical protein